MLSDELLSRVADMGRVAALDGDPVTSCPYSEQDTPREVALARAWVAAYLTHQPPLLSAIDYDQ